MNIITVLLWLACAAEAYLLGSISFAYVVGKVVVQRDIRKYGSGNAGASNMTRNFGWKLGLLTFMGDVVKGCGAVLIGGLIMGNIGMYIAAVFVIVGHNWPVFFGFRGGKGISTTLGVGFILMPWQAAVALGIGVIIIYLTKYVSVASLIGALILAISGFAFYPDDLPKQITMVILLVLAVYSHRENIKRLANGTESKTSFKKARPKKRHEKTNEVKS